MKMALPEIRLSASWIRHLIGISESGDKQYFQSSAALAQLKKTAAGEEIFAALRILSAVLLEII